MTAEEPFDFDPTKGGVEPWLQEMLSRPARPTESLVKQDVVEVFGRGDPQVDVAQPENPAAANPTKLSTLFSMLTAESPPVEQVPPLPSPAQLPRATTIQATTSPLKTKVSLHHPVAPPPAIGQSPVLQDVNYSTNEGTFAFVATGSTSPLKQASVASKPLSVALQPVAFSAFPRNRREVKEFLVDKKEILRHVTILAEGLNHQLEIDMQFADWQAKRIPLPDKTFGCYYFYAKAIAKKELCMKQNGRGRVPGVGFGRCDYEEKTGTKCRFEHVCLFCRRPDHGWYDVSKCERYQMLQQELQKTGTGDEDLNALALAFNNEKEI